jgi:hypothetical protein
VLRKIVTVHVILILLLCIIVGMTGAERTRTTPGRYQGIASGTFLYVVDTATGKVRAFHMKLDVMQAICIEGTVPCN